MNPQRAKVAMPFARIVGCLLIAASNAPASGDARFESTASGIGDSDPDRYVPPLISNGSLCMLIDGQGCQFQREYGKMTPVIYWAGRRYGPPNDQLIPFGHFEQELSIAGKPCGAPVRWSQTLNTRDAAVECRNEYACGLAVESLVFTPLDHDLIVIRKRVSVETTNTGPVRFVFKYQFTPPGNENRAPRRAIITPGWDDSARSMDVRYHVDGHRMYQGVVSIFSDRPVAAIHDGQAIALTADIAAQPGRPIDATFCLLFADSMDGPDFLERATRLRERVRQEGVESLVATHRLTWGAYWDESYVRLPDPQIEKAYHTAQYHLRANATKWSFPVGILNTHWAGRFFGWDEMFCHQALLSSNHRNIARRCPEFRFAGLEKAVRRASHYGRTGTYGARYPWETLEDGTEGAPPGYWMEHVFHMSNIALAAWLQYLYTDDLAYLKTTGYPVIRECARFFRAYMIYETPDGGMFLGKCTDLERLGPAKQNPFMSSCGAIFTLEAAERAAALLRSDEEERNTWKSAAAKLRESLPHDGNRYIPYAGCQEESIASLGGLFPYPLFDETHERQRNAVYHFVEHGRASGNMYPVGNSVCAWYAGWMAAALAALGDKVEPAKLISEAAGGTGCFGELFEINEAKVSMRPWFATASGNFVFAMNQMLLQCRGDEIRIAAGAPETWSDYAFKLACHGNLVAEVAVKGGRLTKLVLMPGDSAPELKRTLVIPERLLQGQTLNQNIVTAMTARADTRHITVRFAGRSEVVVAGPQ